MEDRECVPFAPALVESMRSLGYTFHSAIADLIDNSISANAKNIDIIVAPGIEPSLIILDDGCGMTKNKMYEAMRYGSRNPLETRSENDLGRFGLGMKSASLSQCRKMVVISKKDDEINGYSWDIDYIIEKGGWVLKEFTNQELQDYPYIERLHNLDSGTYIFLSDFDRIKEGTSNIVETFNSCLNEMIDHLALVFHRFIEDGLKIEVNSVQIEAKDPFLSYHKSTQKKKEVSIKVDNERINIKPYILPVLSKLKQKDLDKVGGKERLKNEQGFYIYRNKRLIVWGTWFRLERKDELSKLARVKVDIPNTLDYMWSIDIKKSKATLPDKIKKQMYGAVLEASGVSKNTLGYRGRKVKKDNDVINYIWEKVETREGTEYLINRELPQLKLLESSLEDNQLKILSSILNMLEKTIPMNALYYDVAKGDIQETNQYEIEELLEPLLEDIKDMRERNKSIENYCNAYMKMDPYCRYEEIKNRLREEILK